MTRLTMLVLLLTSGVLKPAYAQVDTTQRDSPQVRVETKDGSQYYGQLMKQDRDRIILRTESVGILEIPLSGITNIQFAGKRSEYADRRQDKTSEFTNPNPFRLCTWLPR